MNEGNENDGFTMEDSEWLLFLINSDEQMVESVVGGGMLPDPNRSDNETVEASAVKDNNDNSEAKSGGDGDGKKESIREIHIRTERERRKKMQRLFQNLHALLPQRRPRADKATIVDEAMNYMKALEHTRDKLIRQKLERLQHKLPIVDNSWEKYLADQGSASNSAAITLTNHHNNRNNVSGNPPLQNNNMAATGFKTWTSPNVVLNICGSEEAQISVCCPKKPGLFSYICHVMHKYKIETVSAQISSDHLKSMFIITTRARGGSGLYQVPQAFLVEERYKQAIAEILSWINLNS